MRDEWTIPELIQDPSVSEPMERAAAALARLVAERIEDRRAFAERFEAHMRNGLAGDLKRLGYKF